MDKVEKTFTLEKDEFSDSDDEKMFDKKDLKDYDLIPGKASKNLWLVVKRSDWEGRSGTPCEDDDANENENTSDGNSFIEAMDKMFVSKNTSSTSKSKDQGYKLKFTKDSYTSVNKMSTDLKTIKTKLVMLLYEKKITGHVQVGYFSRTRKQFHLLVKVRDRGGEVFDRNRRVLYDQELWGPDFIVGNWRWKNSGEVYRVVLD